MTVVVAFETNAGVYLASDSAVTSDDQMDRLPEGKWFSHGVLTLAFAGNLALTQRTRRFLARRPARNEDPERYLVTVVGDAISRSARTLSLKELESEWLAVLGGKVWTIDTELSVTRSTRGYAAIGAGSQYALGAMASLPKEDPKRRVTRAIEAACEFSPVCSLPVHVTLVPR